MSTIYRLSGLINQMKIKLKSASKSTKRRLTGCIFARNTLIIKGLVKYKIL